MSWLRANWKHVAAGVVLLATVTGWISTAHYRGVAKAEAATAARQTAELEELRAGLEELRIRNAELAVELELDIQEEEEAVVELEELRAELAAGAAELDRAIAAAAEASGGFIPVGMHEEALAGARRDAELADSVAAAERRARLLLEPHVCVGCRDDIARLEEIVAGLEERDETREREIAAWQGAAGSRPMLSIDIGSDWWKIVAGAVGGFVIAGAL